MWRRCAAIAFINDVMAECETHGHVRDGATSDRLARGPLLWKQAGAEDARAAIRLFRRTAPR
jgi:hypothetical protein